MGWISYYNNVIMKVMYSLMRISSTHTTRLRHTHDKHIAIGLVRVISKIVFQAPKKSIAAHPIKQRAQDDTSVPPS